MVRLPREGFIVTMLGSLAAAGWGWGAGLQGAGPGSGAGTWAWRLSTLGPGAPDGAWGGAPLHLPVWLLGPLVGTGLAQALTLWLAFGLGAGALWTLARRGGAGPAGAALAVVVGALPPVVAGALAEGRPELLIVAPAAVALAGLAARRPVGWVALAVLAAFDGRAAAVTALAAWAAGGGVGALLGAAAAAAWGVDTLLPLRALDPLDLATPFLPLRPEALAPGIAALAGAALVVEDRRWRRAALVAWALSLGPLLRVLGEVVDVGGRAVPLPAVFVAALDADGGGWQGALVVGAVAAGLGLARLGTPRAALLLAPLALLEAFVSVGPRLPTTPLDPPVAVKFLGERQGGVLDLPVEVDPLVAGGLTAPPGTHGLWLWYATFHGRPLAVGPGPLGAADPLYGEPAVVLGINASLGTERFLLPPSMAGATLAALNITEIVVHRDRFPEAGLAVLDPLLARAYGAPQRDHAGGVDLYRISAMPLNAPSAERLRRPGEPGANAWRTVADWLKEHGGPRAVVPSPDGIPDDGTN